MLPVRRRPGPDITRRGARDQTRRNLILFGTVQPCRKCLPAAIEGVFRSQRRAPGPENRLSARGAAAIFDVGANVGYWALTAARVNPSATIHSFEIVPETFAAFVENTKTYGRIVANAIGLSDREGTVPVHVADGVNSVHFSTATPFANGRRVECPMTRGDLYAARAGIERIDFLKIDVEGGEYDVLMGFSDMLGRGTIGLIQFEYGPASIDSRKLLKDYYNLLT